MKTCLVCGERKDAREFYRQATSPDGLQVYCKDCIREYRRQWRKRNPSTRRANKDKNATREYNARYYAQNRSAILAARKPESREAKASRWQRYYAQNREKEWVRWQARRRLMTDLTAEDAEFVAILRRDPCGYCGDAAGHIDHIDPVKAGGSGRWENLTASCRSCNSSKSTATLLAFLARA